MFLSHALLRSLFCKSSFTESRAFTSGERFCSAGLSIKATASWCAPAASRKVLARFTIVFPRHFKISRSVSVTSATFTALRFSDSANLMNRSASFARTTHAILSWLSEIASSVPLRPSYFFGTLSRSTSRPGASSPIATETPPAPKSLQRRIIRLTSLFLKRR